MINYDTDQPAHYTLTATSNFHDVVLVDQEQAALKAIWNQCGHPPSHRSHPHPHPPLTSTPTPNPCPPPPAPGSPSSLDRPAKLQESASLCPDQSVNAAQALGLYIGPGRSAAKRSRSCRMQAPLRVRASTAA